MDHGRLDHGFAGGRQQVVILTQAAVAIEPPEGALHNPALGHDHKPLDGVRALGHLQANWPLRSQPLDPLAQRPGIGPIRPDGPSPRMPMPEALQEPCRAIAGWHAGGRHDHREEQAEGIDEEMPLAAFALVAGIVPPDPPVSVVLTA